VEADLRKAKYISVATVYLLKILIYINQDITSNCSNVYFMICYRWKIK